MGAYSELDAALREDDDTFMDDPFADDEGDGTVCAGFAAFEDDSGAEPTTLAQAKPSEDKATAQAAGDKTNKAADDEDAKRKAHEEAEAKRKAEWKAEKKKKKEAEKLLIAQIDNMSNDEVTAKSLDRVSADTEKLTRRQMMECVMEHIQTLCLSDPAFARKVMHPKKTMIRCYQYINRKAWEYVQDELKARGITPSRTDPYASAIPEGVCYQWAVDYFNDLDAPEDKEKEEKFAEKPYRGKSASTSKPASPKGDAVAKVGASKDAVPKQTEPAAAKKQIDDGQISFGSFSLPEEKAG